MKVVTPTLRDSVSALLSRDETCSKAIREKGVAPLDKHAQSVSEARQIENVQKEPEPPRGVARDVQAMAKIDYRFVAANGGHVSLVAVPKVGAALAANRPENVSRRGATALNCSLGNAGYGFAVRGQDGEITNDKDLRMTRHAEIRVHQNAAASIDGHLRSQQSPEG
jgi:hypothetical protein